MKKPPVALDRKKRLSPYGQGHLIMMIRVWREIHASWFESESSIAYFERVFYDQLQRPDAVVSPTMLVHIARLGHPSAVRAVHATIAAAAERDTFASLPSSLKAYNAEVLHGLVPPPPPPSPYPRRMPQVLNDYIRNLAVVTLVDTIQRRLPGTAKKSQSNKHRSALTLVAAGFEISEKTVERIYQARPRFPRELAELLLTPRS